MQKSSYHVGCLSNKNNSNNQRNFFKLWPNQWTSDYFIKEDRVYCAKTKLKVFKTSLIKTLSTNNQKVKPQEIGDLGHWIQILLLLFSSPLEQELVTTVGENGE